MPLNISVFPSQNIASSFGSTNSTNDWNSLIVALVLLAQIVFATILFALFFKFKQTKLVFGIIAVIVSATLGYFGFKLSTSLLTVANRPLDWITFAFLLWNFVIVGLAVIFWKGPTIVKQGYLVLMSSMMAFNLSALPSLVSWIVLAFLVVWGLFD